MSATHPTAEQLNAYLLDELDPAARRDVAAHLAGCADCREAVSRLEATLATYRDAEPTAADEAALGRLLAAARPGRRERPRWAAVAVAATAAVVIFLGGFWAGRSDVGRSPLAPAQLVPPAASQATHNRLDREPPTVTFAVADSDLLRGLAAQDTTWN